MSKSVDAPAELLELATRHLEANEAIQSWEIKERYAIARLIDRELERVCAEAVRRFGRGAGCGRTLEFAYADGHWMFVGEGGWIS